MEIRTFYRRRTIMKNKHKEKGKRRTSKHRFIHGIFSNTAQGYGFVSDSKGFIPDVFIPPGQKKGAVSGDKVRVKLSSLNAGKKGFRGKIVSIDEKREMEFLGTVVQRGDMLAADLDIPGIQGDIIISNPDDIEPDHRALIDVDRDLRKDGIRYGRVVEDFGHINDPSRDVISVIRAYGYSETFPESVQQMAEKAASADIGADARKDLTDIYTCTIDPETAKDFDDAISVTPLKNGWELWIHIADVSWYVSAGGDLDREAAERGTSVYLLDTVIPMLPEVLSNGACSLRPGEKRAAKSVKAVIDRFGEIKEYSVHRTVIQSDRRFTYPDVQEIITGKRNDRHSRQIMDAFEASSALRKNRIGKGSIMLDIPEIVPVCDSSGHVEELIMSRDNESHQLIEDLMLLANRCVADLLLQRGIKGPFRIHPKPDMKKQEELCEYLSLFGYRLNPGFGRSDLARIIEQASTKDEHYIINVSILKSFKQAEYSAENRGHFALGFDRYLHFTSPIRRYPDLMVHRALDTHLFKIRTDNREKGVPLNKAILNANEHERRAMEAEQSLAAVKMMRYLQSLPDGTVFNGIISRAERDFISVEIVEYLVYGRLYLEDVGGSFGYDENSRRVFSYGRSLSFGPGDEVQVKIKEIDLFRRRIDFRLA